MSREVVDLFALAAPEGSGRNPTQPRQVSGRRALSGFSRLIEGLPPQADSQVQWSLQGEGTTAGRRFIEVRAHAEVTLECQRCLQPFVLPLRVENRLEVVRSPTELEDDDETERIVGSPKFDVLELIEDELILSLPSVPKHDVCTSLPGGPEPADQPDEEAARPSPFAALEKLKKDQN
ncbi:YceD family protein [Pusillimonas sp.]|uniref:YceD family protein n=1 Tax=Pusillimonas sp. TaxID=3040095 RepID=UPI0037C6C87B